MNINGFAQTICSFSFGMYPSDFLASKTCSIRGCVEKSEEIRANTGEHTKNIQTHMLNPRTIDSIISFCKSYWRGSMSQINAKIRWTFNGPNGHWSIPKKVDLNSHTSNMTGKASPSHHHTFRGGQKSEPWLRYDIVLPALDRMCMRNSI